MGGVTPGTCWASYKYEIKILIHCCILLHFLYELCYYARIHEHQDYFIISKIYSARVIEILAQNRNIFIAVCIYIYIYIYILYACETWSLTLREERRLRVFENRVLRKVFGPQTDEVTGEWRKLHNEELNDLYSLPNIVRVVKSRRMRWAGHVGHRDEKHLQRGTNWVFK